MDPGRRPDGNRAEEWMSEDVPRLIEEYMESGPYAVVGASTNREKYGNMVLRAYRHRDMKVYPINPRAEAIEGQECYPSIAELPEKVRGISVITPPKITEQVVADAAAAGVEFVWMQPGAESPEAVRKARELGLKVIADGSCFLVVAGFPH
jgi:predicted CoA-binding protein